MIPPERLEGLIRPDDPHAVRTRLLTAEALFEVDDFEDFVAVQSEAALQSALATAFQHGATFLVEAYKKGIEITAGSSANRQEPQPELGEAKEALPLEIFRDRRDLDATVVSDRGSRPEVVGDASLVVDIDRSGSLAEAIHRLRTEEGLAGDLRARGSERCRKYSWERCADQTIDIYEGLVG